mmetsp:Transcript_19596/g.50223  ORF Transcript_19596/g.50223 Transcript_19596/m.50223 type:complete len:496 (-) Transcript_19596:364-1851(-)
MATNEVAEGIRRQLTHLGYNDEDLTEDFLEGLVKDLRLKHAAGTTSSSSLDRESGASGRSEGETRSMPKSKPPKFMPPSSHLRSSSVEERYEREEELGRGREWSDERGRKSESKGAGMGEAIRYRSETSEEWRGEAGHGRGSFEYAPVYRELEEEQHVRGGDDRGWEVDEASHSDEEEEDAHMARLIRNARELEEKYGVKSMPVEDITLRVPAGGRPVYTDIDGADGSHVFKTGKGAKRAMSSIGEGKKPERVRVVPTSTSAADRSELEGSNNRGGSGDSRDKKHAGVPSSALDIFEEEAPSSSPLRVVDGNAVQNKKGRKKTTPHALEEEGRRPVSARPASARARAERPLSARPSTARPTSAVYADDVGCIRNPRKVASTKPKRSDPVSAFQRMQQQWKNDRFLSGKRRPSGGNVVPKQVAAKGRMDVSKSVNTYVPPTDKRRDNLRWEVRAKLLQRDLPERSPRSVPQPNPYVSPAEKRRDDVRWHTRLQMNL